MKFKETSKAINRFFFKHPAYYGLVIGLVVVIASFFTRTGQADRLRESLVCGGAFGVSTLSIAVAFPDSWRKMWHRHI